MKLVLFIESNVIHQLLLQITTSTSNFNFNHSDFFPRESKHIMSPCNKAEI